MIPIIYIFAFTFPVKRAIIIYCKKILFLEVKMKRISKFLLSIVLALALSLSLGAGALAVTVPELIKDKTTAVMSVPTEISVIIGDNHVNFFGAKPVWVNDSVFVPLRTLCEKLGVQVSYDDASQTVTCSRYDTSVKLTVGSDIMTKTDKSGSESIKMAAPFYMQGDYAMAPVRDTAAAFGCNVGWDRWTQTVLILDVQGMLKSGPTYSAMNKLMEIGKADKKSYAISGTCLITVKDATSGAAPYKISAEFTGLSNEKIANLDIKYDFSDFIKAFTISNSKADPAQALLLDQLKSLEASFIVDMSSGKIYIRCSMLNLYLNVSSDSWLSLSLKDMIPGSSASSLSSLQMLLNDGSFEDYMEFTLSSQPLLSEAALSIALEQYRLINSYYSDAAFTRDGDTYTSTEVTEKYGMTTDFLYQFTLRDGKLISFSMKQNIDSSLMTAKMSVTMDQDKTTVMSYKITASGSNIDMTMRVKQTETSKTPVSKPESGKIYDANNLINN